MAFEITLLSSGLLHKYDFGSLMLCEERVVDSS